MTEKILPQDQTWLTQQMQAFEITSVYDVINKSRGHWLQTWQDRFPEEEINKFYQACQSRASQITRHYLDTLAQGKRADSMQQFALSPVARSIRNASWPELFPEDLSEFCPPDSIESVDSPVAYLTNLYRLATNIEQRNSDNTAQTLAQRRPDIAELIVDSESVNAELPTQQLVSEILQARMQHAYSDSPIQQVMATQRYPLTLPWDAAAEAIHGAFKECNTQWSDVILDNLAEPVFLPQANASQAAATLRQSQRASLPIAPELMKISSQAPLWYSGVLCNQHNILDNEGNTVDLTRLDGPVITGMQPFLPQQLGTRAYRHGFTLLAQENITDVIPPANQLNLAQIDPDQWTQITLRCHRLLPVADANDSLDITLKAWHVLKTADNVEVRHRMNYCSNQPDPYDCYLRLELDTGSLPPIDAADAWMGEICIQASEYHTKKPFTEFRYAVIIQGTDVNATQENASQYCETHYGRRLYDQLVTTPQLKLPLDQVLESCQLTRAELEKQLCLQTDAPVLSPSCPVTPALAQAVTIPAPWHYGATWLHSGQAAAITFDDSTPSKPMLSGPATLLDRLHTFLRLQQALSLTNVELDQLLTACARAERRLDMTITTNTLRALGLFQKWRDRHDLSAERFAVLLDDISPFSIKPNQPFFDRVFNKNCTAENQLTLDNALFDHSPDGELPVWSKRLCAGLKITEQAYRLLAPKLEKALSSWLEAGVIADEVGTPGGQTLPEKMAGKLRRSLYVVSAFYRLTMLFRLFGYTVEEGVAFVGLLGGTDSSNAWKQLAGKPELLNRLEAEQRGTARSTPLEQRDDIIDVLVRLEQLSIWLTQANIQPSALQLLLSDDVLVTDTEALRQWFMALKDACQPALITENWLQNLQLPDKYHTPGASDADDVENPIAWMAILEPLVDVNGYFKPEVTSTGLEALVSSLTHTLPLPDLARVQQKLTLALSEQFTLQQVTVTNALEQQFALQKQSVLPLLRWMNETVYSLLTAAQQTSTTQTSPAGCQLVSRLGRYASLIKALNLSPAMITSLCETPAIWLPASAVNTRETAPPPALSLSLIKNLSAYATLRDSTQDGEDLILGWLKKANSPATFVAENPANVQHLQDLFAFSESDARSALKQGALDTFSGLARLQNQIQQVKRSGLELSALHSAAGFSADSTFTDRQQLADTLLHTLRSSSQENA